LRQEFNALKEFVKQYQLYNTSLQTKTNLENTITQLTLQKNAEEILQQKLQRIIDRENSAQPDSVRNAVNAKRQKTLGDTQLGQIEQQLNVANSELDTFNRQPLPPNPNLVP
jgi:hypothetical protein